MHILGTTIPIASIASGALGAALLALATSCASTGGDDEAVGQVPMSLIELYDRGRPDGTIEIEIDRDGTIREMESEIPIDELPESVLRAAQERLPDAQITGAERELQGRGGSWEVKMMAAGKAWELIIDEEGNIRETEEELTRGEAPAAVLQGADAAIPGGMFKSVEVVRRGSDIEYHVKKERDGASYKIILDPSGKVLRKVREARAEIEIPLAR